MKTILNINDYSVRCKIGCSTAERKKTQEVRVSVRLEFLIFPKACQTDRLQETVCYATLCEMIKRIATQKEYKLVEHLAHEIFMGLLAALPGECRSEVSVHKVAPPIKGLLGGVHFKIGTFK